MCIQIVRNPQKQRPGKPLESDAYLVKGSSTVAFFFHCSCSQRNLGSANRDKSMSQETYGGAKEEMSIEPMISERILS